MLIIATQSPFTKQLPLTNNEHAIILTQDAVIAVTEPSIADNDCQLYALESDLAARGLLSKASSLANINIVNLSEFVRLTTIHHPIMNW